MLDVVTLWDATHTQWCKEIDHYNTHMLSKPSYNSSALILLGTALDVLENLMDDPCIAVMRKEMET